MATVNYETVKRIGTICTTKNETVEFRIVKWNNRTAKYDLRRWGDNGKIPYKGETFTIVELRKLYDILKKAISTSKSSAIMHVLDFGKGTAKIYQVFGEYRHSEDFSGQVTFTSWARYPKYDIRSWNKDYSSFGKGISLDQDEVELLIKYIEKELDITQIKANSVDTSSIDDLLI